MTTTTENYLKAGGFAYEQDDDWAKTPAGYEFPEAAGVAMVPNLRRGAVLESWAGCARAVGGLGPGLRPGAAHVMFFRVITIAGQPPLNATGPMGKQGSEPPNHFMRCDLKANFF